MFKLVRFIPTQKVANVLKGYSILPCEEPVTIDMHTTAIADLLLNNIEISEVSYDGKTVVPITWANVHSKSTMPARPESIRSTIAFSRSLTPYELPGFRLDTYTDHTGTVTHDIKIRSSARSLNGIEILSCDKRYIVANDKITINTAIYGSSIPFKIMELVEDGETITITHKALKGDVMFGTESTITSTSTKVSSQVSLTLENDSLIINSVATNKLIDTSYKVKVTDASGIPVKGLVLTKLLSDKYVTDSNGEMVFSLDNQMKDSRITEENKFFIYIKNTKFEGKPLTVILTELDQDNTTISNSASITYKSTLNSINCEVTKSKDVRLGDYANIDLLFSGNESLPAQIANTSCSITNAQHVILNGRVATPINGKYNLGEILLYTDNLINIKVMPKGTSSININIFSDIAPILNADISIAVVEPKLAASPKLDKQKCSTGDDITFTSTVTSSDFIGDVKYTLLVKQDGNVIDRLTDTYANSSFPAKNITKVITTQAAGTITFDESIVLSNSYYTSTPVTSKLSILVTDPLPLTPLEPSKPVEPPTPPTEPEVPEVTEPTPPTEPEVPEVTEPLIPVEPTPPTEPEGGTIPEEPEVIESRQAKKKKK